jgi:hypothetical protein
MRIPQLSIRWNFYMRILRLSILLTRMRFLYEDSSTINIAHSYKVLIWESFGYEYCSSIWNFYIEMSQLSILLTHMRF